MEKLTEEQEIAYDQFILDREMESVEDEEWYLEMIDMENNRDLNDRYYEYG